VPRPPSFAQHRDDLARTHGIEVTEKDRGISIQELSLPTRDTRRDDRKLLSRTLTSRPPQGWLERSALTDQCELTGRRQTRSSPKQGICETLGGRTETINRSPSRGYIPAKNSGSHERNPGFDIGIDGRGGRILSEVADGADHGGIDIELLRLLHGHIRIRPIIVGDQLDAVSSHAPVSIRVEEGELDSVDHVISDVSVAPLKRGHKPDFDRWTDGPGESTSG
jgi:hypothetical protein